MNILFVGNKSFSVDQGERRYVGGLELVNDAIFRYLNSRGHNIYYLASSGRKNYIERDYKDYYNLKFVKVLSKKYDYVYQFLMEHPEIDLIIFSTNINSFSFPPSYIEKVCSVGKKVLIYTHGVLPTPPKVISEIANKYNNVSIISTTRFEHGKYISFGVPPSRLYLIRNYSGLLDFPVIKEKKDDYLICVARGCTQKGIDNAIRASKSLGKKLYILGSNRNEDFWNSILEEFSLENGYDYEHLGSVDRDKVMDYVAGAQFMIMLVNGREGSCIAVIESMSVGTPVITWDNGFVGVASEFENNILIPYNKKSMPGYLEENYKEILYKYQDYDTRLRVANSVKELFSEDNYFISLDKILNKECIL